MPLLWFCIWPSIDFSSNSLITNAKNTIPSTTTPPKNTSANPPLWLSSRFFHVFCWGALSFGTQQGHKGPPGVPSWGDFHLPPMVGLPNARSSRPSSGCVTFSLEGLDGSDLEGGSCSSVRYGVQSWWWDGMVVVGWGGGWMWRKIDGAKHVVIFVGSPQQLNIDILKPKWPLQFPRPMIFGSAMLKFWGICNYILGFWVFKYFLHVAHLFQRFVRNILHHCILWGEGKGSNFSKNIFFVVRKPMER